MEINTPHEIFNLPEIMVTLTYVAGFIRKEDIVAEK
jgi:hypothetical protein